MKRRKSLILSYIFWLLLFAFTEVVVASELTNGDSISESKSLDNISRDKIKPEREVEIIMKLFIDCPSWDGQSVTIPNSNAQILNQLEKISKFQLTTIRQAVKKYAAESEKAKFAYHERMGTILLLHRYLFKIPSGLHPLKKHFFGGIIGVPASDGKVDLLWPFSSNSKGNLLLTGYPIGYHNFGYQAVEEFDFFNKTYGVRKRVKSAVPKPKKNKKK